MSQLQNNNNNELMDTNGNIISNKSIKMFDINNINIHNNNNNNNNDNNALSPNHKSRMNLHKNTISLSQYSEGPKLEEARDDDFN